MNTKLIVALDVNTFDAAKPIIDELAPIVPVFKVGSILYTEEGNKLIDYIHSKNREVFLDLKFFDIPNTVKEVSFVAARLGVEMFTIHLLGGREMVRGALEGVRECVAKHNLPKTPVILGVTVLTSMNESILKEDLKIPLSLPDMVSHLAKQGFEEGMRGFVSSPHEIELLRGIIGKDVILVTPGVRLSGDAAGDQKRIMTPKRAKELGANYIVMGRSVLDKPDRKAAVQSILDELI